MRETTILGSYILEPQIFSDQRGFFFESHQQKRFSELGIASTFVQDNISRSNQHVLRGMHYQIGHPQAQLVTVISGRIFDVIVDLRPDSHTFKNWFGQELSDEGPFRQIYMPPGVAHGFYVLSETADLHYKVTEFYNPSFERGFIWNDPTIGIVWPSDSPTLSEKDRQFVSFSEINETSLPKLN